MAGKAVSVNEIASHHLLRARARMEAKHLRSLYPTQRFEPERAGRIRARWVVRRIK